MKAGGHPSAFLYGAKIPEIKKARHRNYPVPRKIVSNLGRGFGFLPRALSISAGVRFCFVIDAEGSGILSGLAVAVSFGYLGLFLRSFCRPIRLRHKKDEKPKIRLIQEVERFLTK